jgi:hypothetical protein
MPLPQEDEFDSTVDFMVAVAGYHIGGNPEELLCACGKVLECAEHLPTEVRMEVEELIGRRLLDDSYADAAHAIRRWLASTGGTRH